MRVCGITLFAKGVARMVFPSAAKLLPTGSQMLVFSAEKSPLRIGIDATL